MHFTGNSVRTCCILIAAIAQCAGETVSIARCDSAFFTGIGFVPGTNPGSQLIGVSRDGLRASGLMLTGFFPNEQLVPLRWTGGIVELANRPGWAQGANHPWGMPLGGPDDSGGIILNAFQQCYISTNVPEGSPAYWHDSLIYRLATSHTWSCVGARVLAVSPDGRTLAGTGRYSPHVLAGEPCCPEFQAALVWLDGALISLEELSGNPSFRDFEPLAVRTDGPTIYGKLNNQTVRWSPQAGLFTLSPPPDAVGRIDFTSFSDDCHVILGTAGDPVGDRPYRAFLWRPGLGAEWLPLLSNGDWLGPGVLSGDGRTWACDAVHAGAGGGYAGYYLCRIGTEPARLWESSGLRIQGWSGLSISSMSFDGEVFGGYGLNPCGLGEGWIAHLPAQRLCAADFNGSGLLSVQDIFDFLESYFGGSHRADWNGNCEVSVQDIFEFLAAYFVGCA